MLYPSECGAYGICTASVEPLIRASPWIKANSRKLSAFDAPSISTDAADGMSLLPWTMLLRGRRQNPEQARAVHREAVAVLRAGRPDNRFCVVGNLDFGTGLLSHGFGGQETGLTAAHGRDGCRIYLERQAP